MNQWIKINESTWSSTTLELLTTKLPFWQLPRWCSFWWALGCYGSTRRWGTIFFSRKGCFKRWKRGEADENKHQLCKTCISTFKFTEFYWDKSEVFMLAGGIFCSYNVCSSQGALPPATRFHCAFSSEYHLGRGMRPEKQQRQEIW